MSTFRRLLLEKAKQPKETWVKKGGESLVYKGPISSTTKTAYFAPDAYFENFDINAPTKIDLKIQVASQTPTIMQDVELPIGVEVKLVSGQTYTPSLRCTRYDSGLIVFSFGRVTSGTTKEYSIYVTALSQLKQ